MARRLVFVLLLFMGVSQSVRADDRLIDGVPLPSDATVAATSGTAEQRQWSGIWVGEWDGGLKHILLVESVGEDGTAHVIYAVGDNPYFGIERRWLRVDGIASGRTLKVTGKSLTATYEMADGDSLKARYARGNSV